MTFGLSSYGVLRKLVLPDRVVRIARVMAVNVGLILLGCCAVELIFGNWFLPYVPPQPSMFDRRMVFAQELYEPRSEIVYIRDKYGLRGLKDSISRVELVTVGGSTTDQKFITEGETWQDVLHAGTGIVVVNAGVPGMTSGGHILVVEDWLHRIAGLHAKYYLHYLDVNDALLQPLLPPKDTWAQQLRPRSAIWLAITRLHLRLTGPIIVNHAAFGWGSRPGPWMEAKVDPALLARYVEETYKPNLRRLLDGHRHHAETTIFVTEPVNPAFVKRERHTVFAALPNIAQWAAALYAIHDATRAVCRENPQTCRFVDLAGTLTLRPADFYDLVHNTPSGSRRIGDFLARELAFIRSL
jgi:hypothetical protein